MTTKIPVARPAQNAVHRNNDIQHNNEVKPHDDGWKNASEAQKIEVLWRELARTREELQTTRAQLEAARRDNREVVQLDELTGLPNYRAFVERMTEEARRASRFSLPLSVLLLDLNNFDALSCLLGKEGAQDVLRGIVRTLLSSTRTIDFVARYGTHQFGVILPGTTQQSAMLLAARLCLAIESHDVQGPALSACFGVTTAANDCLDGKTCIAQAYKAMRYSALAGCNRVTHAQNSGIRRVTPWGDVPSVQLFHANGDPTDSALHEDRQINNTPK
jgi:diguanylate cyclase (GGDEF)-like protein